jgi:6-phosphofructokinase 1
MSKIVGILTSGGDAPGLNAAIRGVGKALYETFDGTLIGFRNGFRGLMENHTIALPSEALSNILTVGGTLLGTSRDKPHRMPVGGKEMDMTDAMLEVYRKQRLDVLVCLGGRGTQKNALKLVEKGMNIVTLPKTIDNDIPLTDASFGFDTALGIATDAIDRLHSTATSHNRIIVVEIMGHRTGWLALGAGLAGGADVILIPELPYSHEQVAEAILARTRKGKHFSIVAVAEGAMSHAEAAAFEKARQRRDAAATRKERTAAELQLVDLDLRRKNHTLHLTEQLEKLTGLESRLTILGHLQRGGTPSGPDRILATRLGATCARLIHEDQFGVMVAARGQDMLPVPIAEVGKTRKCVPPDHHWLRAARQIGVCFGA